jgi:hypothetical protein
MSKPEMSPFLRSVLTVDAVTSGASGILMLLGAAQMQERLGVPAGLLREAGLSLIPFAVFVLVVARRQAVPRRGVLAVIGLNALWVAASVAVLFVGGFEPSRWGMLVILGQAAAVAGIAELEYVGLRRVSASA